MSTANGERGGLALHWRILIGLLAGGILGVAGNLLLGADHAGLRWITDNLAQPLGQIFLRLIFMVVLPLVFSALVLGVAEIGDVRKLGRMGLRTLWMTLILSSASVAIGLALANTVRPGERLPAEQREQLKQQYMPQGAGAAAQAMQAKSIRDMLLDLIPRNPLQ
jgi:DAACS family dicarboxylate/amino acid:cation (Na+ or H+) symporter